MKRLPLRMKVILGVLLAVAAIFALGKADVWYTEHNADRGLNSPPESRP